MMAGVRGKLVATRIDLEGDAGLAFALERYEGLSLHTPDESLRLAPGIEAGLVASWLPRARLAPFLSLRCALFPFVQSLDAAPQGDVGKTPSVWIGAGFGLSLSL